MWCGIPDTPRLPCLTSILAEVDAIIPTRNDSGILRRMRRRLLGFSGLPGLSPKDEYWLAGIDRRTGERVQIHPRGELYGWAHDLVIKAIARRVQILAAASHDRNR